MCYSDVLGAVVCTRMGTLHPVW